MRIPKASRKLLANLFALIGSVAVIGVLFAPWTGLRFSKFSLGDGAAGGYVYWGNGLQDRTAVEISLPLSLIMVVIGVSATIVSAAGIAGKTVGRDRFAGWILIGSGLMVAAISYLLVYAVTSSPFDVRASSESGANDFFHWGPLIGPKLAVLCTVAISGAGIVNVWLTRRRSQNL